MIQAQFDFNPEGKILSFTLQGHADFDESGKDIVCSAVSALSFTSLNSIEALVGVDFNLNQADQEGGYLKADFSQSWDNPDCQLLLNHLLLGLQGIEENYGEYLKVNKNTNNPGGENHVKNWLTILL